ncbi:heterokaryon incompatibility protein-domain-containing protein [Echria macrotheca]|uniref:Heterokaryon incompatibility protein-domain-containing protein n=1 Tax=Echria macrotheca TaxID=438768 RepID=A0AAJ0BFI5_9PEZI|nr:heterokaryon incompatibility protein-domain-containing protein [Echria macrotheca]
MRLIHADTFEMKEFIGSGTPPYAILSHTWGDDEVSFHAMQSTWDKAAQAPSELATQEVWDNAMKTKGFMKIVNSCKQARLDGIEWVWVDTCCIDKTSSAELSEAINSMWAWYRDAWVCYAFLEDVPPLAPLLAPEEFASARWFTRGWCLQELIAPSKLEFYASDWTEMGTKSSLKQQLEGITGIPADALVGRKALSDYNVAQRMSWAAGRKTTRLEDEAYCLLGIFDINMPLLYGEGTHAFSRLQEQILMKTGDYSILLWTIPRLWEKDNGTSTGLFGVFARSPMQSPARQKILSPGSRPRPAPIPTSGPPSPV